MVNKNYIAGRIKDYLPFIITFSIGIALLLLIRPFVRSLLNIMMSSQIGRIITVIIVFGEIILGGYLVYSMLTYQRKEEVLNLGEKWK